jgi:ABC-2 type transport system ATP-binding protein
MNLVEARGLSKSYGVLQAVDQIDLQVRQGEIFGLVGADGAGKTTTLRLLVGPCDQMRARSTLVGMIF